MMEWFFQAAAWIHLPALFPSEPEHPRILFIH
jgi:hypothetical protein